MSKFTEKHRIIDSSGVIVLDTETLEKSKKTVETTNNGLNDGEVIEHITPEISIQKPVEIKPEEPEEKPSDPFGMFTHELKQPTQKFDANDEKIKEIQEAEAIEVQADDDPNNKEVSISVTKEKLKQKAGSSIFMTVDGLMVMGAALIADEDTKNFRLDKETRQQIEEGFTDLSSTYGWEKGLPSWIPLVVLLLVSYGSMMKEANKIRKEKQEEKRKAANVMQIVKNNASSSRPRPASSKETTLNKPQRNKIDITDFDFETNFEMPAKIGRGAYSANDKKYREIIKLQSEQLKKAEKLKDLVISA